MDVGTDVGADVGIVVGAELGGHSFFFFLYIFLNKRESS